MSESFVDQIRRFYEANRQELYTYALALTRNRELAEDAIHGAFASVLKRGRAPRELRPYMFRSVRNAALDGLKARGNGYTEDSIFENRVEPDPARSLMMDEALGTLGEDEREAVVLKVYSGMTLKEIAKVKKVSINTVASWYRRGLQKLRVELEEVPNEEN